jgi:hypothetical protein
MDTLSSIPQWLGAAVIAAVFGVFGFLGRKLFDAFEERRTRNIKAIAKLEELEKLLDQSFSTFKNQNYLAQRLMQALRSKYGDKVTPGIGYDETFYQFYEVMDNEQRELFSLIRGTTLNSMHNLNEKLKQWADENSARQLAGEISPNVKYLDIQLAQLRDHLNAWFDKYESLFKTSERRSLVYLGDEKQQGVEFPHDVSTALDALLRELERGIGQSRTESR